MRVWVSFYIGSCSGLKIFADLRLTHGLWANVIPLTCNRNETYLLRLVSLNLRYQTRSSGIQIFLIPDLLL
jgi:hypothetical protein